MRATLTGDSQAVVSNDCAYQEGYHVTAKRVLHPQWEFAVYSKSVETQYESAGKLELKRMKQKSKNRKCFPSTLP